MEAIEREKETCPACNDTGEVECDECDGNGCDCPACGRGECRQCGGTGLMECSCVDSEA
jgi:hypothetical protein